MDTVYGYDGNGYNVGDRVELHPATDMWMRGARYGTVVGISLTPLDRVRVRLDKLGSCLFAGAADTFKRIESNQDLIDALTLADKALSEDTGRFAIRLASETPPKE